MTESEVFLVGSQFHQMIAIRFVGMLFLIWVGFRLANGIRSSSDSNIIMKVAGSVFVLSVAFFYLFISGMTEMMNNGMAGMLQKIAEALSRIFGLVCLYFQYWLFSWEASGCPSRIKLRVRFEGDMNNIPLVLTSIKYLWKENL